MVAGRLSDPCRKSRKAGERALRYVLPAGLRGRTGRTRSPASLSAEVPITMSENCGLAGTPTFPRNRYAFGGHFKFQT